MTDHQKSECPAATGHNAEGTDTAILAPSGAHGNAADQDANLQLEPSANLPKVALMPEVEPSANLQTSKKRLANLTALYALRGFEVYEVKDGFLVTRWNLSKHVANLDDLERWARVVGAA